MELTLMALVCFGIGVSKGDSALWSAVAGFFGHVESPDRPAGSAPQHACPAAGGDGADEDAVRENADRAVFSSRTEERVVCPVCNKRQRGGRDLCCFCGTSFQYEDE